MIHLSKVATPVRSKPSVLPRVSLVIPCRNEGDFIGPCLDSILANGYPLELLEVLVVDGRSEDATRAIVEKYSRRYSAVRLLDNPKRITPAAFNLGTAAATGDVIMRRDAHAHLEPEYIRRSVEALEEFDADCVGGPLTTVVRGKGFFNSAIRLSMSHPLGVGNSRFRTGVKQPMWVDATAYGCFRRSLLDRVGPYNEKLERSQDMDFWSRVRTAGGRILVHPEIRSTYVARGGLLTTWQYNFSNGFWVTWPWRLAGTTFALRHFAPLMFLLSLSSLAILGCWWRPALFVAGGLLATYVLATWVVSGIDAMRRKDWKIAVAGPLAFAVLHFSYGLGSLWGGLKPLPQEHEAAVPNGNS